MVDAKFKSKSSIKKYSLDFLKNGPVPKKSNLVCYFYVKSNFW